MGKLGVGAIESHNPTQLAEWTFKGIKALFTLAAAEDVKSFKDKAQQLLSKF